MPASYKKDLKKIRPKKPDVGKNLLSIGKSVGKLGSELAYGTIDSMYKSYTKDSTVDSKIKGIKKMIKLVVDKLAMNRDQFETLLSEELFTNNKDKLKEIMSYAQSKNIIKTRLEECYNVSISSNIKKLEKFLKLNNLHKESDLRNIMTILNLFVDKLSIDEVDREPLDVHENSLLNCIIYQFLDPCSSLMGIPVCDKDNRFDFFREWLTTVYSGINPDILSASRKKKSTKKKKKSTRKKKKSKKKKSKKKKYKGKSTKKKRNKKTRRR